VVTADLANARATKGRPFCRALCEDDLRHRSGPQPPPFPPSRAPAFVVLLLSHLSNPVPAPFVMLPRSDCSVFPVPFYSADLSTRVSVTAGALSEPCLVPAWAAPLSFVPGAGGGRLLSTTWHHCPPPPPPPAKDAAKFFSRLSANPKFSLVLLAPISFGQKVSSAPPKTHSWEPGQAFLREFPMVKIGQRWPFGGWGFFLPRPWALGWASLPAAPVPQRLSNRDPRPA